MRKAKQGNVIMDEDTAQPKRRDTGCSPFRFRKGEKDADGKYEVPLVDFTPETKPPPTFVYEDRALETSDIATPLSPNTLKLFEAIREDEMEQVEEELANLTDRNEMDRADRHGFALIHVAARFNGLSTVGVLLQRGADPSAKGKKGSTPLHFAARRGNDAVVKILLERPSVHVDVEDSSGKTALHLACNEGHGEVCQLLLNYGADIQAVSADKTTPLHNAIINGHSQVARMILNRAADRDVDTNKRELVGNEDLQCSTVLHMAAWNNDVKTAELCLDNGSDVNTRKCNESTALHIAATKGNLEMAELLISRGAGVNMKDGDSKTPIHRAALFNQTKLIELLVEKEAKVNARDGEGRSPFLNAVAAGHVDSARILLKLGADIRATDLLMKTCVHIAIENEQLKMLDMLLESRPGTLNLYKADLWDRVPLHYAAKTKDIKILELVLSKDKRLLYRDENQKTPLHLAAESSSSKHVEALARRMSGVNMRDELGRTPLHSAARKGQRKACVTLINMGAEVDSRDNNYRTPLMWSVKRKNIKCALILLDNKASVDLQDMDGDSAFHVACGQGHADIASLLLDRGASLTLRNKQEHTCLDVAAKAGSSDVAMTIVKHRRCVEVENYHTTTGQSAISLLIENIPEAAEVMLNECVDHSQHLNTSDPDYTVTYNFKYLDPGPDVKDSSVRFSAVETMIKNKRERLLLHPLTLKFNEWKWASLGRFVFLFDFVTYLISMILFTIFIVHQRRGQDFRPADHDDKPPNTKLSGEAGKNSKLKPSDIYKKETNFTSTVPHIILVFAILHICKQFFQMYVQRWNYFKYFSNYLTWILHISTALFMVPYVTSPAVLDEWFSSMTDPRFLWILGIVSIFVCYTNMLLFLRRYRLFGTYISMYIEVTKTVIQVMLVFVFIVVGFALVFHVLFMEQTGFHTVHHSILRVLAMMIGELDLGATFIDSIGQRSDKNQNPKNPFPGVAFLFIFLCLFLLTVALMNLLVGLAVGDTETMKKFATIKRLALQIEYHIQVEDSYPTFITRVAYQMVYVEKPNKLSRYHRVMEWLQTRFAEANPESVCEDRVTTELANLREETMKNKKRIKSIIAMLEAQHRLLTRLALNIDPSFELHVPEGTEDTRRTDDTNAPDAKNRASLEAEKESEVLTDDTSVEFAGEKSSNVFLESGL
ncbi:Transient receptor putative cation channel sub A member 1 [Desmophyllum pertusum]|uniref:Transient receptor putative cation channel sub A member 1 n=1 Tax=Desmophyllum pertusum TaxID=174260 RepID=A0A9W9ZPW0_9CNID|nr:Transient receptor putative cation channel sub A member 1 [Desmophyllum pertusum]